MAGRMTAILAAAVLVGGMASARLQSQGRSGSQDILPALLSEVRGLRAAMEQMATAGARVQLALGRVQLQEQRLNTSIRRLEETRQRLTDAQKAAANHQDTFAQLEVALREGKPDVPEERQQLEMMLATHKRQAARLASDIQQIMSEEAALAGDVATEQTRWTEFNRRLEELERALGGR
jgi:chromosome segregation ATPase